MSALTGIRLVSSKISAEPFKLLDTASASGSGSTTKKVQDSASAVAVPVL